jgi:hypothetical protein
MSQILAAHKSVGRHPHADVNAPATAGGGKGLPPYELAGSRRSGALGNPDNPTFPTWAPEFL